jgi:NAD+ synthase (glutamine-hydrolysing)
MKIALAQCNYHVGDFQSNTNKIIQTIATCRKVGADLVVFAELSVCGYPPRDFLEFSDFIRRCEQSVHEIAGHCQGIAAIVGAPAVNPLPKGKPLFNSAWFLADGVVKGLHHKTLLPNYDVFDEYRYFEPNPADPSIVEYKGVRMAITICEDLWNVSNDPLYQRNPVDEVAHLAPQLIINIAASPFHYHQPEIRKKILALNASRYQMPVVYVNHVGGQTELIFDGGSMVALPDGSVPVQLQNFTEDLAYWEFKSEQAYPDSAKSISGGIDPLKEPEYETVQFPDDQYTPLIHDALVLGIRDYFQKLGFTKAILGLSGGIDSAVTMVLAARALGAENVTGILLPSQFSTDHSITDARDLAETCGCHYEIIPIKPAYDAMEQSLEPLFAGLPFNLAEENIQARLRAVVLMALSNKFGYILLNTSNKSEAAVGYGTLYGDMCGGISVLGDVYKQQVYQLASYINREGIVIPENSIIKPPSAELRPGQKDADSLPEYDILDQILYLYIEHRYGPEQIKAAGFDSALVDRVLKLVNTNEYKRHQSPPILRVSPKAFGQGRRMPIVGKYLS